MLGLLLRLLHTGIPGPLSLSHTWLQGSCHLGSLVSLPPPPQYLIPSLFYRVQLPFSQSGVLIELSSGYLKVVARLGLVFMWNDDDSLLVRMGDGCGWAEPSGKMGAMGGVS